MATTVLVVEDDLEINELLGEYLTLEGYVYLQATAGQAGLHLATSRHPDAIILDLMLPDTDGFEIARTLSSHRATHDIPIIILSCMCESADKLKGFAAGALFFMTKPFLPDDLINTVRKALEWKAALANRPPQGTVHLGCSPQDNACSTSLNEMLVDLFAKTELHDQAVAQIREGMEKLHAWALQWNGDHAATSRIRADYRITSPNGTPGNIEWTLTEDAPGLLADAFFKTPASAEPAASPGMIGGLIGWAGASVGMGGTTVVAKPPPTTPIAPPSQWMQLLAKTGALRFEKDSRNQTVRFSRSAAATLNATPAAGPVPVVEIDGTRYPTRLRDEALAAKRR